MASHSKSAVVVAGAANLGIAAVKLAAAAVTGSASMLSEGIHSIVDTLDQALLLLGMRLSKRPPDARHPFGHGHEVYFWSTIVGTLIFGVGGGVSFYEGLLRVMHGGRLENATWSYVVLGVAFVFESTSWVVGARRLREEGGAPARSFWRRLRDSKDPTVVTVILEDSAAIFGIALACGGLVLSHVFRLPALDGVAAMGIGALLMVVAVVLIRESRSLVIGESADPEMVVRLREIFAADPSVHRVGEVLTMHFGPDQVLVNAQLEFEDGLTSGALEDAVDRIEARTRRAFPIVSRIFVELEPLSRKRARRGDAPAR
jgi:cation diffusion facilitator family transporter